jgi:hypothetical protein
MKETTTTIKVLYYKYSVSIEREREIILITMKRLNFLTHEEIEEIEERKRFIQ